jgi:hypothetical protein
MSSLVHCGIAGKGSKVLQKWEICAKKVLAFVAYEFPVTRQTGLHGRIALRPFFVMGMTGNRRK